MKQINYGLKEYADSHPVEFAKARQIARKAGRRGAFGKQLDKLKQKRLMTIDAPFEPTYNEKGFIVNKKKGAAV